MQDIYRMMEERSSREFAPEGEFDKQAWAERKQSERQEAFDRADAAARPYGGVRAVSRQARHPSRQRLEREEKPTSRQR